MTENTSEKEVNQVPNIISPELSSPNKLQLVADGSEFKANADQPDEPPPTLPAEVLGANGGPEIVVKTIKFDESNKIASACSLSLGDSYHYEISEEPTTESDMYTEESIEKMTSSTEGMISLSEDSSGKDTYAQAATAVYNWPGPTVHSDTIDLDDSDDQMNGLMGSYREISMDEDEDGTRDDDMHPDTEEEVSNLSNDSNSENDMTETDENRRPNSLLLLQPVSVDSGECTASTSSSNVPEDGVERTQSSASQKLEGSLSELSGTITKDGDMVTFVAADLQEKIKMASPISKRGDIPSYPTSRSSTPNLYKQALTPQLPPIDPSVLVDIESQVQKISASLDNMLENLLGTLQSMSSLSVDCVECYQNSVCQTCDSMDANIKSMYQLMAKCEELGNTMRPMYRLADQIKEIKRLLDLFEPLVNSGSSS